ncbi:hypothetical protein RIF29_34664 [Crotalaria pallida]|uniref:Uncharacterized protein n=1 Tax=Crotalaria pallida TaxID=3830 RepID=A0AAN9HTM6_CROPI
MASPNGENPPMASPNGEDPPMTTPNGEGPTNTKTKKRTRGLTAMKMVIRARSKNIKLHMVSVTYDNWHDKALSGLKDIIWQDIISAFDVEEEHNTYILQSAGRSHRQFRTDAGKYVRDAEGNINLKPPKKYENIIHEADWIAFVKKRTEDEKFLLDRPETNPNVKMIDLEILWVDARKNKAGIIDNPNVQEVKDRCVSDILIQMFCSDLMHLF